MEKMEEWILSAACCGILMALIHSLLPKGTWSRLGQLAGGILMILTVVGPLVTLDMDQVMGQLELLAARQEEESETLNEEAWSITEELINEEYEAYILERAQELGILCQVEIECRETDAGIPIPGQVIVTGDLQDDAKTVLSQLIADEFGADVKLRCGEERG